MDTKRQIEIEGNIATAAKCAAWAAQDTASINSTLDNVSKSVQEVSKRLSDLDEKIASLAKQVAQVGCTTEAKPEKPEPKEEAGLFYTVHWVSTDKDVVARTTHMLTETWESRTFSDFISSLKTALELPKDDSKMPDSYESYGEFAQRLRCYNIDEEDIKVEWEQFSKHAKAYKEIIDAMSTRTMSIPSWGYNVTLDDDSTVSVGIYKMADK